MYTHEVIRKRSGQVVYMYHLPTKHVYALDGELVSRNWECGERNKFYTLREIVINFENE